MSDQSREFSSILKFLNEGNYEESFNNSFEAFTSEDIKQFMIFLGSILLKNLAKKEQLNILKLINDFLTYHPKEVILNIKFAFANLAKLLMTANNSVNGLTGFGVSSYFALKVLLLVLKASNESNDSVKNLMQYLFILPSGCLLSGKNKIIINCKKLMKNFLLTYTNLTEQIISIINSTDCKVPFLGFLEIVSDVKTIKENVNREVLVSYIKLCFNDKMIIPMDLLKELKSLLSEGIRNKVEFDDHILPIIQRSTIRSPEKSLWVIKIILNSLNHLDLSSESEELAKVFCAQLQSKSEIIRNQAKDCLIRIVSLTSESESIKKIVLLLEKILNQSGSDKITSVDIRQHIWSTITEIPKFVNVGSSDLKQDISLMAVTRLINLIGNENQESICIIALESIAEWSKLNSSQFPLVLSSWFKNTAFNPKLSSVMKIHYFNCLNLCCDKIDKLSGLKVLLPQIQDMLEKLSKSPTTVSIIQEILPIIELLLRYFIEVENITDGELIKSNPIFNLAFSYLGVKLNISNVKMFNDQILLNSSKYGLKNLIGIIKNVMISFFDLISKLPDHFLMMLRCLFLCGIHHDYLSVRKFALDTLSQLTRSQNGEQIVSVLLEYLYSLNLSTPTSVLSACFWPYDNSSESINIHDIDSLRPFVQRISEFIDAMLKLEINSSMAIGKLPLRSLSIEGRFPAWWDDDSRIRIMYKALLPINQHMITHFYLDLWAKHSQNLLDSTDQILIMYGPEVINRLATLSRLNINDKSVVTCLCRNFSDTFISQFIGSLIDNLNSDKLFSCSEDEVGIMNTKEGYLYNKTLLHSLPKYELNKGNIKRENKMYSYKEQMAEIEIRKEVEKKKSQNQTDKTQEKVDNDNPLTLLAKQLTKNQMEQVNAELEKEKSVRSRLKELENKTNVICDILENISYLRNECILKHFDEVIKILEKLIIESPIARIRAALLFNKFRDLTTLSQRQSVWILRIILLDSSIFSETLIENWKNNINGKHLLELINPWMEENLSEYSVDIIETNFKQVTSKKHFDFPTLLYLLPAYCRLCQSISDMECIELNSSDPQWWCYLTWMDIELLRKILETIFKEISSIDINKKQLFNTHLLSVLVKVIQHSEIPDIQDLIETIVLSMMRMFSDNDMIQNLELNESNAIDTILECFVSDTNRARMLTLKCIDTVDYFAANEFCERLSLYLWIAKHDCDSEIAEKAANLWCKLGLTVDENLVFKLQDFVILPYDKVMIGAIGGIKSLIKMYDDQLDSLIRNIFKLYDEYAYMKPPVCDAFGRVLVKSPPDQWRARYGFSKTLLSLYEFILESSLVENLFNFLIPRALGDRNQEVRKCMLETGQKVIEYSGKDHINMLLPIMENYLINAENISENDIIRQSVVILMGSLAKHLESSDERFINIFGKLIAALNFPSADVQRSVSDTFDPLIKAFDEEKQREICNNLLLVLLNSQVEAERKGAAFGIAGIIKAIGITKLKTFKIYDTLIDAIQNKQNEKHREIALFTFEQISSKMSKMFEPYVPGILKYLQDGFADPSNLVRQTADRTAKMLMSNLSGPGVKLVLNPLLTGLDTNQWRTKSISVELLGSMAYCAPKQLSNCLPTIVPKILSILSDSHPNVIKAGRQALREIGSVIHNKEVQVIVPLLIDALCEPNKKTNEGLDALIETKFIHQVDAASLALIMSMVARAFKERRSDTKRKAAQIIGNLHSLTDDKDLQPYCSSLLPGLKSCLVDPDPTVRTVASKALGTIAKVMTPVVYEELMCWLMDTLKDESSGVNRSGAAQGFSEVLMHKGIVHLRKFMPDILENSRNQKLLAHVRDGYLMLYIYLPKLFQEQFAEYVELILPPILQALSDEVEFIRDTALNAGQGIIEIYSHIAIDTMLPNLELGMLDSNWRIRYSSIKLLGELLFRLTGISGKGTTTGATEDESFAQAGSQDILIESLGEETYHRVLAKIYISRMDVALLVKQSATHIWKLMVVNTARSLRLIMKNLMEIILDCLSDSNDDCRIMCTKTLGDVVKKLGERILPDIFGHLETGFEKCLADQRMGICTAISEILKASPKDQIGNYLDKILPTFKHCMIDEDEEVREMAGEIFELLHSAIGIKIVEIVIPDLVDKLDDPDESDNALNGLCTLVSFKGRIVIPFLIPKLTYPKVNTKAFSKLAKVAGDILSRHIQTILPAFLQAVSHVIGDDCETEEVDNCCEVILAMNDPQVTQVILKDLTTALTNFKSTEEQIAALKILSGYIKGCKDDDEFENNKPLMNYIPIIIRSVVKLFLSDNKSILLASFDCVAEIITSMGTKNVECVKDIRDSIVMIIREKSTKCPNEEVLIPAFCLNERGITPFIELYREALVNGRSELKEVAASAMEDCITVTETGVLCKAAVKIAGPLIRTMAERHNSATKAAIVSSLGKLIEKCPTQVKLFATQMQTIFMKCLADPNQPLRYKTSIAQSKLAVIITKPDQFFIDFIMREFNEENQYKATGMESVRFALETAGNRLSKETLTTIMEVFKGTLGEKDDQIRVLGATCLGVAMTHLNIDDMHILKSVFDKNTSVLNSHSLAISLIPFLKNGSSKIFSKTCPNEITNLIVKLLEEFCNSDKVFISSAAHRALGFALVHLIKEQNTNLLAELLPLLQNAMKNSSMEIKELAIEICGYLAWSDVNGENVNLYAKSVLAVLINCYRAKENQLRINSEKRIMDLVHMSISLRKRENKLENIDKIDETVYQTCCDSVEQGIRSALQEVVIRFKKTILSGSKECPTTCPNLDNTYNKVLNEF